MEIYEPKGKWESIENLQDGRACFRIALKGILPSGSEVDICRMSESTIAKDKTDDL